MPMEEFCILHEYIMGTEKVRVAFRLARDNDVSDAT